MPSNTKWFILLRQLALVWYKRYFPTVYINQEGKWNKISQRELIIDECNSSTEDDDYYLKYPRGEARLSFNKENQIFEINNDEVYLNSEDSISNFRVKGVTVDKTDYDYFDVWNIIWTDGIKYHVVIGQSIGRGYEKSNISKFIKKYGEICDDRFLFAPYEKCNYLLKRAVVRYHRHGEYYWLRREIKDLFKSLILLKWRNMLWNMHELKERISTIRYMVAD